MKCSDICRTVSLKNKRKYVCTLSRISEESSIVISILNGLVMAESKRGSGILKVMKVSDDLFDIIGIKEANRGQVVKELWAYLKKNKLQDPEAKQYFTPDKKTAKVFGTDRMKCFAMSKFLTAQLSELK